MVTLDEVAALALALPEAVEGTSYRHRSWNVAGKAFAWERPFSKADVKRFGDEPPPAGPIVAVRVEDLHEKEAVLAANPGGFFTIPHFNGYPAVLVQLDVVTAERWARPWSTGGSPALPPPSPRRTCAADRADEVLGGQQPGRALEGPCTEIRRGATGSASGADLECKSPRLDRRA